ncbi:unnamed protein product, partial [marine sediment metagenome]
ISREKIIKIEYSLEEKDVKKERVEVEIPKQKEPYDFEYPTEKKGKKLMSIYLGGGLNNISGGDLNGMIKDWNEAYKDYDDYFLTADYSADWKELKWLQNLKGEILFNLSPSFSIGLGVEYLIKKNKGDLTIDYEDSGTFDGPGYYYNVFHEANDLWEPEYKLSAIPITFNVYFFIPIDSIGEVFITGGVGFYFGRLEYNEPYEYIEEYLEDYYGDDDTYWYSWIDNYSFTETYIYEAKCNQIGFHGGIGFDIKLLSNISLVVEGNYRYVNFKNWEGSGSDNWSWDETWGWSDLGYSEDSGSGSESWEEGKIWYWEYNDSDTEKQYKRIFLLEEEPEVSEEIKNVRQAEINLNGFSLRLGIRFSF